MSFAYPRLLWGLCSDWGWLCKVKRRTQTSIAINTAVEGRSDRRLSERHISGSRMDDCCSMVPIWFIRVAYIESQYIAQVKTPFIGRATPDEYHTRRGDSGCIYLLIRHRMPGATLPPKSISWPTEEPRSWATEGCDFAGSNCEECRILIFS